MQTIENLGVELDAIRQDIEDARGESDARYIVAPSPRNERSRWQAA